MVSVNAEVDPDIASLIGASAALAISGMPFMGPIGAARVGYIEWQIRSQSDHQPVARIEARSGRRRHGRGCADGRVRGRGPGRGDHVGRRDVWSRCRCRWPSRPSTNWSPKRASRNGAGWHPSRTSNLKNAVSAPSEDEPRGGLHAHRKDAALREDQGSQGGGDRGPDGRRCAEVHRRSGRRRVLQSGIPVGA